jgi:hypothetical protein
VPGRSPGRSGFLRQCDGCLFRPKKAQISRSFRRHHRHLATTHDRRPGSRPAAVGVRSVAMHNKVLLLIGIGIMPISLAFTLSSFSLSAFNIKTRTITPRASKFAEVAINNHPKCRKNLIIGCTARPSDASLSSSSLLSRWKKFSKQVFLTKSRDC